MTSDPDTGDAGLEERAQRALESITDPFYLLDREWRFVFINQRALEYFHRSREQVIGRNIWEVLPNTEGSIFGDRFKWAMREARTAEFETVSPVTGRIVEVRAYPSADGLGVSFRDVTERRRAEARDRFLVELDDATRALTDPEEITRTAARLLGKHLNVDRCAYADASIGDGAFEVTGDFCRNVRSMVGRYTFIAFGHHFAEAARAGIPFVVHDVEQDPRTERTRDAFVQHEIHAAIAVSLLKRGALAGSLAVHQKTPRQWESHEVDIVVAVANRCWESIERARLTRRLRESEERLLQAAAIAGLGTFDTDLGTAEMAVNEPGRVIYGWTPEVRLTFSQAQRQFHPADRDRVVDIVRAAFEDHGSEAFDVEHRIVRTDGTVRWIRVRGRALFETTEGQRRPTRCLGTFVDITDRKEADERRERLLQSERDAREEAERLARLKDEFLATVSHELRTPLNAILGWSQLLRRRALAHEETQTAIETIDRNARAQAHLIDDLLDMSRIVSGSIRIETQVVDVDRVARAAVESVQPSAIARGIPLHYDARSGDMTVLGDPVRLQQVFWNLLSNAVKFTSRGGRIDVRLERSDEQVELTVTDTGIGIHPDFLPHIFEPFRQEDASTTRRHGGVGLGLSIAKRLVDLHGGSLQVASEGEGKGASFTVALPIAASQEEMWAERRRQAGRADGGPTTMATAPLVGIRIMVVDDEPDTLDLVRYVLETAGARVVAFADPAVALRRLQEESVDVVVSDIGMPQLDGYEFMRRLRAARPPHTPRIRAIAVSAYARPEDRDRALASGYEGYLSKPVDVDQLTEAIALIVRRDANARE